MRAKMIFLVLLLAVVSAGPVYAFLTPAYQFNGLGNWSIDAVGSNNTPVGAVDVYVPAGSIVQKAFLYSSLYSLSGPITAPTVQLAGTTYGPANFTSLGSYQPQAGPNPNFYLGAYRADVTAQVSSVVGSGGGTFSFMVNSETPNTNIDGEVLAVVYSNPAESQRTIVLFDGYSTSAGDSFTINLANPLDKTVPGFEALYSLGIGFGAGGTQYSTVDINVAGNRLTSSAGGADDGSIANGALITAGGLGDSPANPANPNLTTSPDDELYTLDPFLNNGITSFKILTQNPSLDDNIFFSGLNITAEASVQGVPEPLTLLFLGFSLVGVAGIKKFRK